MTKVTTLRGAAGFVDRVGIALVFPAAKSALPSLWRAIAGDGPMVWIEEREDGSKHFTPEMSRAWEWKDALAAKKLCCAGKHIRGRQVLISRRVLPALYALTGRSGEVDDFLDRRDAISRLELDIGQCVLEAGGPLSAPEIRKRIGSRETAKVNRAIDQLQKMLVLTKAGVVEQQQGWPAGTLDLLPRRFPLGELPEPAGARALLAKYVHNLKELGR